MLPDAVVLIASRLALPTRWRRRLEREAALRRGSDRSGRRAPVTLLELLRRIDAEAR